MLVLSSCNSQESRTNYSVNAPLDKPCNIKVEIVGQAPDVHFKLFSSAAEKTITIDRQIDLLDEEADEFSFSTYLGGKINCEAKTSDSYGPDVTIKVFVNGKLWQESTGKYNPKVEGVIPGLRLKQ